MATNDETRAAAERLTGNCWNSYLGDPPRNWQEIFEKLLADGRTVATELARLRAANAELAGAINAPLWLVWSNEHRAWWGPNGRNYYWGIESAGRYTLAEAQKICGTRGVERGNGINPPELVQPSPELIAMWDAAARAAVVAEKGTQ